MNNNFVHSLILISLGFIAAQAFFSVGYHTQEMQAISKCYQGGK